jgi:hypothetical protein
MIRTKRSYAHGFGEGVKGGNCIGSGRVWRSFGVPVSYATQDKESNVGRNEAGVYIRV